MKFVILFLCFGALQLQAQKDITVNFSIDNFSSQEDELTVDVFKFYISSIQFQFEDDSLYSEPNSYHLINIEKEDSKKITVTGVPEKKIKRILFTVGTDSIANVSGAMDGDLDPILGMYWAWNSGYVNFKIEGKKDGQKFVFHIGGYNGPQASAVSLSYAVTATDSITIGVHPKAFLEEINLKNMRMVMIPGEKAVKLTENYPSTFDIVE